jgi:hypothetical protein
VSRLAVKRQVVLAVPGRTYQENGQLDLFEKVG